ncbi:MAG: hypothetical protein QNJ32_30085 [Xenococcaceae cyanobacterium MO_167.B27]|nr:hypothetical protein [Xenococcaceae cyanobacterium MO_167.B27]
MITRNDLAWSKIKSSESFMLLFSTSVGFYLLSRKNNLIIELHNKIGEIPFLLISLVTAVVFCLWLIPYSTDLMTNSAAGLTEKFLGEKQRTLVINSTTNLPELFLMFISLGLGRLGGVATPLGSNFANIYLMFAVAPIIVIIKWLLSGKMSRITDFINLLKKEKKLVIWHLTISFTMFMFSSFGCWSITGIFPFVTMPENTFIRTDYLLLIGGVICLVGVGIYFVFEQKLKKNRPEIFEDIEDADFDASWIKFGSGTVGVILSCYLLNLFFMAFTQLYEPLLKSFFGTAIFAYLHYFIGSFISSLPETTVAVENYERLTSSDLNTALASASVSNMSNLAIAFLGSILASLFILFGLVSEL